VADLIDASTEAAARSAVRSLEGAFSNEIDALAARIIELRLLVEATLDFPEEEIEFLERAGARQRLAAAAAQIDTVLASARQGALLRDGVRVVLAGQPNVGKSSLLNALAGAELAIVTEIPGTTRDKVGETIQIEGVPIHVVDTAGLREAGDAVEAIGIARSWSAIGDADAVVFLRDLTRLGEADYDAGEARIAGRLAVASATGRVLEVFNKADAVSPATVAAQGAGAVVISAATGAGLDGLRRELLARAGWQAASEGVFHARARHVDALQRARVRLGNADAHARAGDTALELVAEELRAAHDALGEITGAFTADDLLGAIFSRFCIGK
jgi:tRNA modification GTPase